MALEASSSSIAVIVVSCDAYADLWPTFFALFRRFWSDCPYPVYLVSNEKQTSLPGIINVPIGPDRSWSSNLRQALTSVKEGHVLLFLDDLFLVRPVETARVNQIAAEFIRVKGSCLKLNPTVPGNGSKGALFTVTSPGSIYRASTVTTLWSRPMLHGLLAEGETAWEFEINGSERSDAYTGFYAAQDPHFSLVNGVIKGRWSRVALKRVTRLAGANVVRERRVLSPRAEFVYQFALLRSWIFLRLPIAQSRRYHAWYRRLRRMWGSQAYTVRK